MGQKKRAREQSDGLDLTVEQRILVGLADLLDLPPDQTPAAVLTKLADQLGCDVGADGTLTVREEPDDSDDNDSDEAEQVPIPCAVHSCWTNHPPLGLAPSEGQVQRLKLDS